MLDAVEIQNLEKRWRKWKFKAFMRFASFVLIFACIIPLAFFAYKFIVSKPKQVEKKLALKTSRDNNQAIIAPQNNTTTLAQANTQQQAYQQNQQQFKQQATNQTPTNPVSQPAIQAPLPKQNYYAQTSQAINRGQNQQVYAQPLPPMEEEYIELEEIDDVELEEKKPSPPPKPPKPKIQIQTSEIQNHKNLIDKFEQTKDIVYALMLAEEYYHEKEYKDSLRWAIKANNIDPQNQRSWVIFAKSMVKNGSAQKALRALKEYDKQHPNSYEIKKLIAQISDGALK